MLKRRHVDERKTEDAIGTRTKDEGNLTGCLHMPMALGEAHYFCQQPISKVGDDCVRVHIRVELQQQAAMSRDKPAAIARCQKWELVCVLVYRPLYSAIGVEPVFDLVSGFVGVGKLCQTPRPVAPLEDVDDRADDPSPFRRSSDKPKDTLFKEHER